MDMNNKIALSIIWAICIILCVVAASYAYYRTETNRAAIEAGLVQDSVPGQFGVYWTKPNAQER